MPVNVGDRRESAEKAGPEKIFEHVSVLQRLILNDKSTLTPNVMVWRLLR